MRRYSFLVLLLVFAAGNKTSSAIAENLTVLSSGLVDQAEEILKPMISLTRAAAGGHGLDTEKYLSLRKSLYAIEPTPSDLKALGLEVFKAKNLTWSDIQRHKTLTTIYISQILIGPESRPLNVFTSSPKYEVGKLEIDFSKGVNGTFGRAAGEFDVHNDRIVIDANAVTDFISTSDITPFFLNSSVAGNLAYSFGSVFLPHQTGGIWGAGLGLAIHEFAHAFDLSPRSKFAKSGILSASNEWLETYEGSQLPSSYATGNCHEYFAEAVSAYYLDPEFKCYAPLQYEFFSKFLSANPNVYGAKLPYSDFNCTSEEVTSAVTQRANYASGKNKHLSCINNF